MAFITGSTPEWGYEKSSVQDMLQEPFPSRPVDCEAGAVGTNKRLPEDENSGCISFFMPSSILWTL
jgi:hypothetical protein